MAGEGPAVRTEAERILSLLPAAPAASLRNSLEHAFAGHWPDPALPPPSVSSASQLDALDTDDDEEEILVPATLDRASRTPSQSRLADLPGKVVRVFSYVEVHVHEPTRLLAAARATGWTPLHDGAEDDNDPHDIVGAV